jgi:hypothetical protein
MPGGMTGVELAVEAREFLPNVKILLTSGYPGDALAHRHSKIAEWPVIRKPFRQSDLAPSSAGSARRVTAIFAASSESCWSLISSRKLSPDSSGPNLLSDAGPHSPRHLPSLGRHPKSFTGDIREMKEGRQLKRP